jgi:hypothetical protein
MLIKTFITDQYLVRFNIPTTASGSARIPQKWLYTAKQIFLQLTLQRVIELTDDGPRKSTNHRRRNRHRLWRIDVDLDRGITS